MDRRSAADYKKIVVSQDGKALLGGVLVGDATLLQMMLNRMALPPRPESLILPALEGAAPKALGVARRCRTARRSAPAITSAKAISARR